MKKVFNVDSTCKDMRIDRWFRLKISKLPQSLIEKYLRNGKIKVNNKKTPKRGEIIAFIGGFVL